MVTIPEDELWAMPQLDQLPAGGKVIELGNKKNQSGLYREYYEAAGLKYTCVDWNGEDGAIKVDFGIPIPECFESSADLVTNFGFTEHVYTDQVQCWENVARLSSKLGCYLAMVMPTPGHWDHHGVYQPHMSWLMEWCGINGYDVHTATINDNRRRHVNVIGAQRTVPFEFDDKGPLYHTPDFDEMYITPPARRVNPAEKNCGIVP